MTKQVNLELSSWNRFRTNNFAVVYELLGRTHVFTFEQSEIAISLPHREQLPTNPTPDAMLNIRSRRTQDDEILEVYVHQVYVLVGIPGRTALPEEALNRPVKAFELFSEQQQQQLNELAAEYENVASRALDLWTRTLRWKADDHRIGLPELRGAETGWGTYLKEKKTQTPVWVGTQSITIPGGAIVTTETWNAVSAALSSGEPVPVFWELLYDAEAHLERGDLQRTVVDAAVAAETYMRTVVQEGLPADLNATLRTYVDEANVRRVIDKFFPERLDTRQKKTYKTLRSGLHKMFNDRNTILHSGQKESLTVEHCRKHVKSARDLVLLTPS